MTRDELIAAILSNTTNAAILARLPELAFPDCWLVSGAIFQTVWNVMTSRPSDYGIKDYDLFYFDEDTSYGAEDLAIRRAQNAFSDLGAAVELRNQARVHLWYPEKFGAPYPPARKATDGIDRFLMRTAQIGIRRERADFEIYAPHGFDDIAKMTVRPNVTGNFQATRYLEKAHRWKSLWPELTIVPV